MKREMDGKNIFRMRDIKRSVLYGKVHMSRREKQRERERERP